jgi:nucleoside-diphosphate-sugar epimerase
MLRRRTSRGSPNLMFVVTGASGFLGRAVVAELIDRRLPVMRVARSRLDSLPGVINVQVTQYADFAPTASNPVLIHLAETRDVAEANRRGEGHVEQVTNVLAGLLRNRWDHVVYGSSAVVYGDDERRPRAPHEAVSPQGPYAQGKLACEHLVIAAGGTAVRVSNVYGPGMASDNVVSDVMRQIPGNGELKVRDVAPVRDFLWAADAAAGLVAVAMRGAGGLFNLGTGKGASIGDLARRALDVAGETDRPVIAMNPDSRNSHLVLDITQTVASLDWRPVVNLDRGLAALLKVGV